jgi:hypothetical protein
MGEIPTGTSLPLKLTKYDTLFDNLFLGGNVGIIEENAKLVQSMVGCTIVRSDWFDRSPDSDWTGHEQARIWLSDGRVIEFGGWGYDAWGATVREINLIDVDECLYCKESHKDLELHLPWGSGDKIHETHKHAWCKDGNHVAWIGEP